MLKTIKIESKIKDEELIESLLNMKYSGFSKDHLILALSIHALANKWHISKLAFALKELEIYHDN